MAEAALVRAASGTPAGCAKLDHQIWVLRRKREGKQTPDAATHVSRLGEREKKESRERGKN